MMPGMDDHLRQRCARLLADLGLLLQGLLDLAVDPDVLRRERVLRAAEDDQNEKAYSTVLNHR